jgi:hypothetical protein
MKIISIISENNEINEGPIRNVMPAFTKAQKLRKATSLAAAGATKGEVAQIEAELLTYMEYSGQNKATPEVLKNYFKQKGLGTIGAAVVDAAMAKKQAVPANPNGNAAAGLGGNPPANPNPAPPAAGSSSPPGLPGPVTELFGGKKDNTVLTTREVRQVIQQVVQKAYGGAAGYDRSRFAEPSQAGAGATGQAGAAGAGSAGAPDITNFVNSLTPQQKAQLKAAL